MGGELHVVSGSTFSPIRVHIGQAGDGLGYQIGFFPDLDGDGVPEYWTTAYSQPRHVFVFSGSSGQPLHEWYTGLLDDEFGSSVSAIEDVTGDGIADVAVGAPGSAGLAGQGGAVYVFNGATGFGVYAQLGSFGETIGQGLASTGDLDGDGYGDYMTDRTVDMAVFSGRAPGGVILQTVPTFAGDVITGRGMVSMPDFTGDGVNEVLVASQGFGGPSSVLVTDPTNPKPTGPWLFRCPEQPESGTQGGPGFPSDFDALGDLDLDGLPDWAWGDVSFEYSPPQTPHGLVRVFSGRPLYARPGTIESSTNYRVDFELNAGYPRAGNAYLLLAGASGTQPGVPVNNQVLPLNFDILTDISIALANVPPFHGTLGTFDALGRATAWFDGSLLPAAAVGVNLSFGYYSVGPGGVYVSENPVAIPVLQVPP